MPRVPLILPDTADPVVRPVFARLQQLGVAVPNLYRALANAPDLLDAWTRFAWPLRSHPRSSRALRELLILRVAQITGANYEWVHHRPMALQAGVDPALVDHLHEWEQTPEFDAVTRSALRLTDELATTGLVGDETFELVAAEFDPEQIVEIVLTVSFYCCVSRVLHALDIEPETDAQTPAT